MQIKIHEKEKARRRQVPASVEEGVHVHVHEDGDGLLVGEAVQSRQVVALQAAEVVSSL